MPKKTSSKGVLLLILFVLLGLVAGSLLSQLLRPVFPFLAKAVSISFLPEHPLALGDIFQLLLSFSLRLDVASIFGLLAALFVYWRL